jgi:phosphoglycolate phosphatase
MLAELGIPAELIDDATLRYRQRYVEWGAYQASLYPGVLDAIDTIAATGHRLATATSKGEGPTRQMLEHFGITDRFEVIGAASMDSSAITKSAVLERTLDTLGNPDADECWMVGDRRYDVTGSASFGIPCIGVLWGYGTESELVDAGAAHLVADPTELPPLIRTR